MRPLAILVLLSSLLALQTAALWHGIEHHFHVQDEACQLYVAAERLAKALTTGFVFPSHTFKFSCFFCSRVSGLIPRLHTAFAARAPPALWV